jgi:fructokinase
MPGNGLGRVAGRPLLVGEVLYDVFPGGRAVLGGAPFNVAWHLRGLGASPLLLSAVGGDPRGRAALAAMEGWGLDTDGVGVVPGYPTGEVEVRLEEGEPRFAILPDQAYDHLPAPDPEALRRRGPFALLYHGTLFARSPGNRQILDALPAALGLPVFLDLNLRDPWWSPGDAATLAGRARWVKLNAWEMDLLAPGTGGESPAARAARLREALGAEALFLTRGPGGALVASRSGVASAPAPPVRVVDTVGAGDAFSAVAILGLLAGWAPAVTLDRAVAFAARVCEQPGATADNPGLYAAIAADWLP